LGNISEKERYHHELWKLFFDQFLSGFTSDIFMFQMPGTLNPEQ